MKELPAVQVTDNGHTSVFTYKTTDEAVEAAENFGRFGYTCKIGTVSA